MRLAPLEMAEVMILAAPRYTWGDVRSMSGSWCVQKGRYILEWLNSDVINFVNK